MAIFELSSKKYKNGRRPFTAALYELQPPECVVDNVGTKYNKNGITFLEEYASKSLDSIKDMSVRVEFIDEDRTMILGHGETGINDGLPLFNNATTVGHFTNGYIADVEINGETKRCVCGKGYLDEMAYQPFIISLEEQLNNGCSIDGSIEIYRTENNDAIVYLDGWHDKGRIPTEYIHSGWDFVLCPADESSTLLELNNSKIKKEDKTLDEKELKELIQTTICETNSKNEELNAQIAELNSQIVEKDNKISELNASVEQLQATIDKMEADHRTYWEEREILEKELAKAKVAEKLAELDTALSEFNEKEKECASEDIEKLTANLNACKNEDNACGDKKLELDACKKELNNATSEINAIVDKICRNIVAEKKKAEADAKIAEQNSVKVHKETEVIDIFSEMCTETQVEDEDINIF